MIPHLPVELIFQLPLIVVAFVFVDIAISAIVVIDSAITVVFTIWLGKSNKMKLWENSRKYYTNFY